MTQSLLRKLVKGLLLTCGVLLALIGIILFLTGINAYINPDSPEVQPFEQILLSIGFLGFPTAGVLLYKTRKSLVQGMSRYGLPDAPGHSFLLTVLTITTVIVATGAFVIALTVF